MSFTLRLSTFILCVLALCLQAAAAETPLRVFIRAGVKTHGPGEHDHPQFLKDYTKVLADRGVQVDGAEKFPTVEQLAAADVLVLYAADAATIVGQERDALTAFLQRGGGLVAIHDAVCGNDPDWFKSVAGGAWRHGKAKWQMGENTVAFQDFTHPITLGTANFQLNDEIYYELDMHPDAKILATAWLPDPRGSKDGRPKPHVFGSTPGFWTFESGNHRAFVSIPGHYHKTFAISHFRSLLLRGIAWAGKRDANLLLTKEEISGLRYPEGGPTEPSKAGAKVDVHPDFEMKLVASEPLISKPMAVDWDASGRLWVLETPEYPQGRRTGLKEVQEGAIKRIVIDRVDRPARDTVSILTDTDGDGVMDQKQVFADGLELATGFVFHKDGIIVSQAPQILWLRDTDGDGKAETRTVLYDNLGSFDTHAVINNLRQGPDGWIYATNGYSSGDVVSPDGKTFFGRMGNGLLRFKPDGSAFEQLNSKGGNAWGVDVTSSGEVFWTQPTSNDLLMHHLVSEKELSGARIGDTRSYKVLINNRKSNPIIKHEMLPYVQIDVVGGFTAAAGCTIYEGGAWPAEWNGSFFTSEPTINIIHHEKLSADGLSYAAAKTREAEFVASRDDTWFRPIDARVGPDGALFVCDFYNQAVMHNDTRGPTHSKTSNEAIRIDRDHYFGRIWRIQHKQAVKLPQPDLAKASVEQLRETLNTHPNKTFRFTAQRLLAEKGETAASTFPSVLPQAPELARLRELQRKAASADSALKSENSNLNWTKPSAMSETVALYPLLNDNWSRSAASALLLKSPAEALRQLLAAPASETLSTPAALLAAKVLEKASASDAASLVQTAASSAASPATQAALLRALVPVAAKLKPTWTPELATALQKLTSQSGETAGAALPLAFAWAPAGDIKFVDEAKGRVLARLKDASAPDEARLNSLRDLASLPESARAGLVADLGPILQSGSTELQKGILELIAAFPDETTGRFVAEAYGRLQGASRDTAFDLLLRRPSWARLLLAEIESKRIPLGVVTAPQIHQLRNHPDKAVAEQAVAVIRSIRGADEENKNAAITRLSDEVSKPGDNAKGKELYVAACASCHQFGDLGKAIGPTLTGMGAHGPRDLLVHIVDPNREVEPSYHVWNAKKKDGSLVSGIIARDAGGSLTLRNQGGDFEVSRADLASFENTGRSLMPEGFEGLQAENLRNLLSFMCAEEGRFRILDLKSVATSDTRRGLFGNINNTGDSFNFRKLGLIQHEGVLFEILDPARTPTGKNIIVLQGGPDKDVHSMTMPKTVEIPVGQTAAKIHLLSGVGAWASPYSSYAGPVITVTATYADGQTESWELLNGKHFVDFLGRHDAPGSQSANVTQGDRRLRYLTLTPKRTTTPIKTLRIESAVSIVAPVVAAITVESGK